jgi:hypothetical protein
VARLDELLERVRRPRPPVKFPQIIKHEPPRRPCGDYRVPPPPSRRPV